MITPLSHSGMARVLKRSHSFTCTVHTPRTSAGRYSFFVNRQVRLQLN